MAELEAPERLELSTFPLGPGRSFLLSYGAVEPQAGFEPTISDFKDRRCAISATSHWGDRTSLNRLLRGHNPPLYHMSYGHIWWLGVESNDYGWLFRPAP